MRWPARLPPPGPSSSRRDSNTRKAVGRGKPAVWGRRHQVDVGLGARDRVVIESPTACGDLARLVVEPSSLINRSTNPYRSTGGQSRSSATTRISTARRRARAPCSRAREARVAGEDELVPAPRTRPRIDGAHHRRTEGCSGRATRSFRSVLLAVRPSGPVVLGTGVARLISGWCCEDTPSRSGSRSIRPTSSASLASLVAVSR
jgi:hypothetical protein